ncbi:MULTISPECIES: histidine phosphatase family protein [Bacillus]|uniref:Histidine phosphatase family protein n=1 Tax=Bacillus glycinifermentans TaxID=1664069 RepID=A0AAJ3YXD1_9BACI|nr:MULTISPECIES: histidine phosphatase family protein [Bacillus]KKB72725.1 phosphatase [Bacillus sp. TH008]MBU8787211.1 histidine phosphatase family protein [Bacillus glycinifermentans]MDU0073921.1 histidine phosphatase family protein [Bacillus sp. IG6]MED8021808.1 histidine phosphatase family protein [Bacillus glycinifermentans]NUJ17256.1 histidine phosphatase family protein [Bacillus glycinifermentans]
MLTLYIARHGQTEWNIEKRMQGWEDSKLTPLGLANAEALGEKLKDIPFQAAYVSTSGRAVDSAMAILKNRSIPIIKDGIFKEISLGSWEGKTFEDIKRNDPEMLDAYFQAPERYIPNEGESFRQFEGRVRRALGQITEKHREGNILLVTHSVFILMLLNIFKKRPIDDVWNSSYVHDTALAVAAIKENGDAVILKEGDGEHRIEQAGATW